MSERNVSLGGKCILCGDSIPEDKYLCSICGDEEFISRLLTAKNVLINEELQLASQFQSDKTSFTGKVFSLFSDIIAYSDHPFLTRLKDLVAKNIAELKRSKVFSIEGTNIDNFKPQLRFLNNINVLSHVRTLEGHEIYRLDSSLLNKVENTLEMEKKHSSTRSFANFAYGFFIFEGIVETYKLLKKNGQISYGEGITPLYPIRNSQIIMLSAIPLTIFILREWLEAETKRGFLPEVTTARYSKRGFAPSFDINQLIQRLEYGAGIIQDLLKFSNNRIVEFNPIYDPVRERVLHRFRDRDRDRK